MIRRFEFVGGTSAKFWEVEVGGRERHGPLRPPGHRGPNPDQVAGRSAAAERHAEKLIGQKIGKGYRETSVV